MEAEDLPGVRKAAVLLLTMDDDLSKEILKDLEEEEIEMIGKEISSLRLIPESMVTRVHDEFMKKLGHKNRKVVGGEDRFKSLIKKSFGDEKAEEFLGGLESKKGVPGEFLRRCDPKLLANILRGEHPQTIALIFSTLGPKRAGDAIAGLPDRIQGEVVKRMAHLQKVDMSVLGEIESLLKEQLENVGGAEGKKLGGVEVVAQILNQMDRTVEGELLARVEEDDPDLAERIRQFMFTFEDLVHLDDKSVQLLLKEVSSDDIGLALKGATEPMKEKIFANMSERAAAMLKEDLEAMGPVRVSDVEKTQVKIAMVAKKLESEGKIILSRGNERFI